MVSSAFIKSVGSVGCTTNANLSPAPPFFKALLEAQPNEKLRSLSHDDGAYARDSLLVGTQIKATQQNAKTV